MKKAGKSVVLEKGDYESLAQFRYALRKFLSFSEAAAKAAGVTPQQHQALLVIKGYHSERDFVTIGELAERLQIKHHSAVGLVDRLEIQGLVKRTQSRDDRRTVNVQLTRRGTSILERLTAAHRDELGSVGKELKGVLEKIVSDGAQEPRTRKR